MTIEQMVYTDEKAEAASALYRVKNRVFERSVDGVIGRKHAPFRLEEERSTSASLGLISGHHFPS
ncbi:hypothetical protein [Bacillus sp. REN3]|uniref:hypothetical protein n=1 Tax=Bacillus sp. REN3 TaxID=2802440 RepID=UPI001AED5A57|nr:hypothetical protein [Bacillus sp. REN3]